jgi:hypothetical protein
MIIHPSVIALTLSSVLISFIVIYAAFYSIEILRKWDIRSGSELQLGLERKTYLISTFLNYTLGFQLISLFFYLFVADHLHAFLVGAMCAAGSLHANNYGYPTLILKLINFLLVGIWLILNYTDNRAHDYPLIKKKNIMLLIIAPLIVIETFLQGNYFLQLKPSIITSCCGTLFSSGNEGVRADIFALPIDAMRATFFLSMALTAASGLYFYFKGRGGYVFSGFSALTFVVSILSVFSFISLYIYEMPTHHCPFCVLQKEYDYIGFPLYLALFGGVISGVGAGLLTAFKNIKSLADILPGIQKRLTLLSLSLFAAFLIIVIYKITFTSFILEG